MKRFFIPVLLLAAVALSSYGENPAEYFNAKSAFTRGESGEPKAVTTDAPMPITTEQWTASDIDLAFVVSPAAVATFGTAVGVLSDGARFRLQATGTVYFSNAGKAVASMAELSYLRADVPEFFTWQTGDTMQFLAAASTTVVRIRVSNP